jgi:hypothetical protein
LGTGAKLKSVLETGLGMGLAGFGLLLICASVYGLCRIYKVPATLPVVVVALVLVQVGAVHGA